MKNVNEIREYINAAVKNTQVELDAAADEASRAAFLACEDAFRAKCPWAEAIGPSRWSVTADGARWALPLDDFEAELVAWTSSGLDPFVTKSEAAHGWSSASAWHSNKKVEAHDDKALAMLMSAAVAATREADRYRKANGTPLPPVAALDAAEIAAVDALRESFVVARDALGRFTGRS